MDDELKGDDSYPEERTENVNPQDSVFYSVRKYPWISVGILAFFAILTIIGGYFVKQPSQTHNTTLAPSAGLSIFSLVLALALTWAILLTPVIVAIRKVKSFFALFPIYFEKEDFRWGALIFVVFLIVSGIWDFFCQAMGWINNKSTVGNMGEFVNAQTKHWGLLVLILGAIIAPVIEEIFFRGLLFPILALRYSIVTSGILSAFCFAIAHIQGAGSQDLTTIPTIFALGIFLAYVRNKTNRLNATIYGHIFINLTAYISTLYLSK